MFVTVLSVIGLILLISAAIAGFSAAPWLPTLSKDREHLFSALDLKPGQTVIDLGAGDGSLLFGIARRFPGVICIGYEISLLPLLFSYIRKGLHAKKYRHVHMRFGDLFRQPLHEADVIFIFLLAKSYPKLLERLKMDMKEDAHVVVEAWPLPGVPFEQKLKKDGCLSLYFYSAKHIRGVQSEETTGL